MGSSKSKPTDDFGAIEFELTDIDAARSALDELPAGVERVARHDPGYWESRRRPPGHAERAMSPATLRWLASLPAMLRPNVAMHRYPWVVNRIAQTWASAHQSQQTFEDLLDDRRGGRRGFPFNVEAELRSLRQHRAGLGRR